MPASARVGIVTDFRFIPARANARSIIQRIAERQYVGIEAFPLRGLRFASGADTAVIIYF
jgi:hypothetical protein